MEALEAIKDAAPSWLIKIEKLLQMQFITHTYLRLYVNHSLT